MGARARMGEEPRNIPLNCSASFTGGSLFELRVLLQLFPRLPGQARLPINRLAQRFGAGRAMGALKPFPVEQLVNQPWRVGGDGRFLLLTGRVSDADVKS